MISGITNHNCCGLKVEGAPGFERDGHYGRGAVKSSEKLSPGASGQEKLTDEEKKQVNELKKRDQEVKSHESAHMAAAGQYASGGATYTFQAGPDGNRYAVGGEVSIDTSPVSGDPKATIIKMQQVRSAALAPASPSGQDRAVASAASATMAKAQKELQNKIPVEATGQTPVSSDSPGYTIRGENRLKNLPSSINLFI